MRSVKRAAERVAKHSSLAYKVFTTIGYAIPNCSTPDEAQLLFDVLGGKHSLEEAIPVVGSNNRILTDNADVHDQMEWSVCGQWAEWWTRPRHLSKYRQMCWDAPYTSAKVHIL